MHKYVDLTFFYGSQLNDFAYVMLGMLIYLKKTQKVSEINWHEHTRFSASYGNGNISVKIAIDKYIF